MLLTYTTSTAFDAHQRRVANKLVRFGASIPVK